MLLTGATGFLGAHLLHALAVETDADLHCLVRGNADREDGRERIRRNLERCGICSSTFSTRIRVVHGDLSQPDCGLGPTDYQALAENVDAIYHAAADVSWVLPYRSLRDVNVAGTRELIRLACAGRPADFHFVSSLSVCYAIGGPASVREDDDMMPFVERLPLGYAQSKCVAESLTRQASAAGLRAFIHRPSLIAGDSRSGASNEDDFLAALIKGCIHMGAAPDLDWVLDAPPVDHVARAIVRLPAFAGDGARTFHIANGRPRHWRECVLWMNLFGYPVRLLSYTRWREQLAIDVGSPAHPLHALRSFFLRDLPDGSTVPEHYEELRRSRSESARTWQAEQAAGLDCPRLDADLMQRYFDDYVARGFLPAPRPRGRLPGSVSEKSIRVPGGEHAAWHNNPRLVEYLLRRHFEDPGLTVCEHRLLSSSSEHSIIGELTAWRHRRRTGLFHYSVALNRHERRETIDLIVKAKPADRDVIEVAQTVAAVCDPELARAVEEFGERLGIAGGHLRELAIYDEASDRVRALMPVCYGTWRDDERQEWGVALERLRDVVLMDSSDEPGAWTASHIDAAIAGLAQIHAAWYGREAELQARPWIGHIPSRTGALEMAPLWRALARHAEPYLARWTEPGIISTHHRLLDSIGDWWGPLDAGPRTLVHNDFSTRNVALRRHGDGFRLCAYDWELATIGAPQRDLAELLCFVLTPQVAADEASRWVERHRTGLAAATGHPIDGDEWWTGFRSALADLLVTRLAFYTMIHRVRPQRFLPRVVATWLRLYTLFQSGGSGVRSLGHHHRATFRS